MSENRHRHAAFIGSNAAVRATLARRQILSMLSFLPVAALHGSMAVGATSRAVSDWRYLGVRPKPTLFSSKSLWNAIPVEPELSDTGISLDQTPWVEEGAYSSRIFYASENDKSERIFGRTGREDLQVANEGVWRSVVIPRFPPDTTPATGLDGHCSIVDPATRLLHSFFQLRKIDGRWRASKYVVSQIDGTGFGTASNPDNVRASGTSAAAGLMLKSERELPILPHALALCLDVSSFVSGPVFPATMEDYAGILGSYKGEPGSAFSMGTHFMLPRDFSVEALRWDEARVIARTLKRHGAYLVDATRGTASLAAEIGSGWSKHSVNGIWQNSWVQDLKAIFGGIRPVIRVAGWLDADGLPFTPTPWGWQNILSMRGPWRTIQPVSGKSSEGGYDGGADMYSMPATNKDCVITKHLIRRDKTRKASWRQWMDGSAFFSNPVLGAKYHFAALGSGEISGKLVFKDHGYRKVAETDAISPGESRSVVWPNDAAVVEVQLHKSSGPEAALRLELTTIDPRAAI